MNNSAKQMLVTIYSTLRLHQEMIHETLCATNALVKALGETDPKMARSFQKHHLQVVSDTVQKHSQALSDIDAMIERLKEMPE
jgi:hypothetical protein